MRASRGMVPVWRMARLVTWGLLVTAVPFRAGAQPAKLSRQFVDIPSHVVKVQPQHRCPIHLIQWQDLRVGRDAAGSSHPFYKRHKTRGDLPHGQHMLLHGFAWLKCHPSPSAKLVTGLVHAPGPIKRFCTCVPCRTREVREQALLNAQAPARFDDMQGDSGTSKRMFAMSSGGRARSNHELVRLVQGDKGGCNIAKLRQQHPHCFRVGRRGPSYRKRSRCTDRL